MSDELSSSSSSPPCAQLSIIVDLTSSSFDFKTLYNHLSSQPPTNSDHHHWHFGGLRSYTIPFQSNHDETTINRVISKLKLLQNHLSILPPFWISYKKCQPPPPPPQQQQTSPLTTTTPEVIRKNVKLGKFYTNNGFDMEYTGGALVELNKYIWDIQTQINEPWRLVFYHDKIDIDYGCKEKKMRKTLKVEMMDRCAVIMTQKDGFTLFINMNGNPIEYEAGNSNIPLNTNEDGKKYFFYKKPNNLFYFSKNRILHYVEQLNQLFHIFVLHLENHNHFIQLFVLLFHLQINIILIIMMNIIVNNYNV
jgi:hypothetical protein